MEIREIQKADLADLLELYADLHDEIPASVEQASAAWDEIHQNTRIRYFGAFKEGTLAASCTITLIPNLTRGCSPYGLIENVVTRNERRREGYGKAVLEHALEFAWQEKCYKVMLMTGRQNEETYKFYESAGFDRHSKTAFIAKPED